MNFLKIFQGTLHEYTEVHLQC